MPSAIEVNLFQGVFNFIYKLEFSKILNFFQNFKFQKILNFIEKFKFKEKDFFDFSGFLKSYYLLFKHSKVE